MIDVKTINTFLYNTGENPEALLLMAAIGCSRAIDFAIVDDDLTMEFRARRCLNELNRIFKKEGIENERNSF